MPLLLLGRRMPRKIRDLRLDTRTARLRLAPRGEPYWRTFQLGRAIGYRRLSGGKAGTWIARLYSAAEGRNYRALGSADDVMDADGGTTLTFGQAQECANDWFRDVQRNAGRVIERITVATAMNSYIADYLARGGKAERGVRNTIARHILPHLGNCEITSLNVSTIRTWHHALAAAPAHLRTSSKSTVANVRSTTGAEGQRARRSTANRVLTVLKAALNLTYRDGRVPSDNAWRRVQPFANVDAPRVRYLTDDEVYRLVNACTSDLRTLVTAALLTACRFGELARLRSSDFDAEAAILHIRDAKAGKPRTVPLTAEAQRFFSNVTAKSSNTLILSRSGNRWGVGHHRRPLHAACAAAGIDPPVSFHVFRHTAASRLVQSGVSMTVIAALLGNSEAICARHYAHLSQSYLNEMIRSAGVPYGIVPSLAMTAANALDGELLEEVAPRI
jgi:integrase